MALLPSDTFWDTFIWDIFCVNSNSPMALLPSDTGREKEDKWCCHRCACKVSTKKSHQWGKNRGTDLTKLKLGKLYNTSGREVKISFSTVRSTRLEPMHEYLNKLNSKENFTYII